jgi:hypothetical protein
MYEDGAYKPYRSSLVLIDDDERWLKKLQELLAPLLPADVTIHVFSNDRTARAFVEANADRIFGYVQDILRPNEQGSDRLAGILFQNDVVRRMSPWAKTAFVSFFGDMSGLAESIIGMPSDSGMMIGKNAAMKGGLQPVVQWLLEARSDDVRADNPDRPPVAELIQLIDVPWSLVCAEIARNPTSLRKMDDHAFERLVAEIFRINGWDVQLTGKTRDGGYDILAMQRSMAGDFRLLIEAKRFAPDRPVGVEIVRSLDSVRSRNVANKAIIATSSFVTRDARQEFSHVIPWELEFREYAHIIAWCKEYDVVSLHTSPGILIPGTPPKPLLP